MPSGCGRRISEKHSRRGARSWASLERIESQLYLAKEEGVTEGGTSGAKQRHGLVKPEKEMLLNTPSVGRRHIVL